MLFLFFVSFHALKTIHKYIYLFICFAVVCGSDVLGQTFSDIFPSLDIELTGMVSLEEMSISLANDVWGWTDASDSSEYILLGADNGVCFIKIESGGVPHFMGRLPAHSSTSLWRDVKVIGNYAYVVSESPGHGLQVFDLTELRSWDDSMGTVIWAESNHVPGFSTAHNLAVHDDSNSLYILGSNFQSGGVMIYDVSNPLFPSLTGIYGEYGYFHDAQIVTYSGPDPDYQGEIILIAANTTGMVILNVTDPTDVVQISYSSYPNVHYAHQVWMSDDGAFILMGDELDETSNSVSGTRTLIWDAESLDAPFLVGEHLSSLPSSDHNQYISGELTYQSNYKSGLRILNTSQWSSGILTEVAYFDVYPEDDASGFSGSWSNYPYFNSGYIAVSSIDRGLFVVKQNVFEVSVLNDSWCSNDLIDFNVSVPEGFTGPYELSLEGLPVGVYSTGVTSSPTVVEAGSTTLCSIIGSSSFSGSVNPLWVLQTAKNRFESRAPFSMTTPSGIFLDHDGDGFGNPNTAVLGCDTEWIETSSYVTNSLDCDDSRAYSYPLAPEVCDFQDNDCNGLIDDNISLLSWYSDDDGDGFGDPSEEVLMCAPPAGYVNDSSDCNDDEAVIYPGAIGTYQGFDNNCDGVFQPEEHHSCPGDFNFDNTRNIMDILEILGYYGCEGPGCVVDLDEDGEVTVQDLLVFLIYIGVPC